MKVYLRMTVMIILAHVTGSLVLIGNLWGAATSALGCLYQMGNVLIFAADEPVRLSKRIMEAITRMGVIIVLSFGIGYLIVSGSITGILPVAIVALYQTYKMIVFVYRRGSSPA